MEAFSDRRFGGVILRIDRNLCVGFGDCIDIAPAVFFFDDDGIAAFREPPPDVTLAHLLEACRACPVDALSVIDGNGATIAP